MCAVVRIAAVSSRDPERCLRQKDTLQPVVTLKKHSVNCPKRRHIRKTIYFNMVSIY